MADSNAVRASLQNIEKVLNYMYPEREAYVRGLICSVVAEKHIFVLGPPGTAKTEITQQFMKLINGASLFDFLMMRSTTPDEVFGPVDLAAYKAGNCRRFTGGTAVDADVIFLDEIWKGGSVTLNGFLRMMSQGEFTNGSEVVKIPLRSVVGASNELPQEDDLGALYSRFALRYEVHGLKDEAAIERILFESPKSIKSNTLRLEDLVEANQLASAFEINDEAKQAIMGVRVALIEAGYDCDIRRMNALCGARGCSVMKAHAWLRGADEVEIEDVVILADGIWESPEQIRPIRRIVNSLTVPGVEIIRKSLDQIIEDFRLMEENQNFDITLVGEILSRTRGIEKQMRSKDLPQTGTVAGEISEMLAAIRPIKVRLARRVSGDIAI